MGKQRYHKNVCPSPATETQRGPRVGAPGNKARMFKQRLGGGVVTYLDPQLCVIQPERHNLPGN